MLSGPYGYTLPPTQTETWEGLRRPNAGARWGLMTRVRVFVGMWMSCAVLLGFTFVLNGVSALAQAAAMSAEAALTADAIMARVAGNQDRAEAERGRYVYVQQARVVSRRGKTMMCEEVTDSRVTPTASGSHAELLKLEGRLLVKHAMCPIRPSPRPSVGSRTRIAIWSRACGRALRMRGRRTASTNGCFR